MIIRFGRHSLIMDDDDYEALKEFSSENVIIRESKTKGVFYATIRQTTDKTRREYHVARLIMGLEDDDPRKVLYKDKDSLNLSRSNLMIGKHRNATQGRRKARNASSKYKGVTWVSKSRKWRAQIKLEKPLHLGYFFDEKAAASAYNEAAKKHFGKFARLNVIDD